MDACGVGAEPKYWEGAGTVGPNQLCFRVLKKTPDFGGLFISLLTKALKNALSGPTQNCSWEQRRIYASGVRLAVPFVQQFFFPLRSAAEQKAMVVWKQKASCRKTST